MSPETAKHAVVFGASGILGWATVNTLLSDYPEAGAFSSITALTNRPLPEKIAQWPRSSRLHVVSGIDLLGGTQQDLESCFKDQITSISSVTHVYYCAYTFDSEPHKESIDNMAMLQRTVQAIESLSPNLEFVVLPTGTKAYGVHLLGDFPFANNLPLSEKLPRIPEPGASQLFYYWEVDALEASSKGKKWSWCELRPDNVNGFVPNNNTYCLAQTLAIYLSLYVDSNGIGSSVPFPGTAKSWQILHNDASQDIVAKFAIYASLHGSKTGGRAFNVCDTSVPTSWSKKWPIICTFFGLVGTEPEEGSPQPGAYIAEHRRRWDELAAKSGLRDGIVDNNISHPGFQYFIMTLLDFDRHQTVDAMREVGFSEEIDTKEAWWTAFERFRKAKSTP